MSKTLFRTFLTLSWGIGIIGVLVDILTVSYLPPLLLEYQISVDFAPATATDNIFIGVGIIMSILLVVSYIGLYRFKNWGRRLFIIALLLSYTMAFIDSTTIVSSVWANEIYSISYIFVGIVIAVMFFNEEINSEFMQQTDA